MRLPIEVVEESRPRKLEPKRVWTQHFCRPSHEYFRNRKSCIFILEVDLDLDLVEAVSLTSAWPEADVGVATSPVELATSHVELATSPVELATTKGMLQNRDL